MNSFVKDTKYRAKGKIDIITQSLTYPHNIYINDDQPFTYEMQYGHTSQSNNLICLGNESMD